MESPILASAKDLEQVVELSFCLGPVGLLQVWLHRRHYYLEFQSFWTFPKHELVRSFGQGRSNRSSSMPARLFAQARHSVESLQEIQAFLELPEFLQQLPQVRG